MPRSLTLITALLIQASFASAQQAPLPEQGSPPSELVEREGFFTANNAPSGQDEFEVHIVAAGDTLWALAGQHLNNPFLWPQLWEGNEHIINPHWIYPGDPILIRPITLITDAGPPPPVEFEPEPQAPPRTPVIPRLRVETIPVPPAVVFELPDLASVSEVKASDLYCSGFITTRQISRDWNVMAKFPASEGGIATASEYVYLSRGSDSGLNSGEIFTVVRSTRNVSSTRDGVGDLGLHYLEVGQVRVVMAQPEFSLARVIHACDGIEVGDFVVAFESIDFPQLPTERPFNAMMPSTGKTVGAVAITRDALSNMGSPLFGEARTVPGVSGRLSGVSRGVAAEGQIVYIDLGDREGIRTGDLFLIYRPLEPNTLIYAYSSEAARLLANQREVIGELVVLKVEERSATALVTFSSHGVSPGDSIELR